MRVAWDSISIIDPLFTLPLIALLTFAGMKRKLSWARGALIFATAYLAVGFVQRDRAREEVRKLAASRGHTPLRLSAKPSIGNLWLFRGLYETSERFYADAVRVPFWGENRVYPGDSVEKFQVTSLDIPPDSTLARDIRRFAWFSDDYLCRHPAQEDYVIGDFRYALLPDEVRPLWGIVIDPSRPDLHVIFDNFRDIRNGDRARLWAMLMGRDSSESLGRE